MMSIPTARQDFPAWLDALGIETAAEIGVGCGAFSAIMLRSNLRHLYLVDDWQYGGSAPDRDAVYRLAENHPGRVTVVERRSPAAADQFADESLDLAYIDTHHTYAQCIADCRAWWPKVRRILAGHDYTFWIAGVGASCGVVPAVEEFSRYIGRQPLVTGADPGLPSRLLAAHRASQLADCGPWGEHLPSWFIAKEYA